MTATASVFAITSCASRCTEHLRAASWLALFVPTLTATGGCTGEATHIRVPRKSRTACRSAVGRAVDRRRPSDPDTHVVRERTTSTRRSRPRQLAVQKADRDAAGRTSDLGEAADLGHDQSRGRGGASPRRHREVPWLLFFDTGVGIHGAFWHESFGQVRSHGCINLSPGDAAHVFHRAHPALPVGWTARAAHRLRSRNPPARAMMPAELSSWFR